MNRLLLAMALVLLGSASTSFAAGKSAVEDLFRKGTVSSIEVSPGGNHIALVTWGAVKVGNPSAGYIKLFDLRRNERLSNLEWAGEQTLLVQYRNTNNWKSYLYVARLENDGDQYKIAETTTHSVNGYVDDPLPETESEIIFARVNVDSDDVSTRLYRFKLFSKTSSNWKGRNRIDTGTDEFFYYLTDSNDNYVIGVRSEERSSQIWRRNVGEKDWSLVWTAPANASFRPAGISPDGNFLWAVTDAFTDKNTAVELNLSTGELERVLFEHERFDTSGIVISRTSRTIDGYSLREQGLYRYEFISEDAREQFAALQEKFPGKGIRVTDQSDDGLVKVIFATTSQERGSLHLCDLRTDACELIQSVAPWLDDYNLVESVALTFPSDLGVLVDAFLTLPDTTETSVPLIVMPHGGPIGVSDNRYFAPDAQWLAMNGYAVLQVNFRGSSGYGQSFKEAGHQEWGRGIEDDIEKATYTALDQYPILDRNRVGIFGGSYGGYSALMSVIRNPELYVCAASYAGVTDLTLLFSNTRMHNNQPATRQPDEAGWRPGAGPRRTKAELPGLPVQRDFPADSSWTWCR